MTKKKFTKRILVYEIIGFLVVIIVLWLDEIFDLLQQNFHMVCALNVLKSSTESF